MNSLQEKLASAIKLRETEKHEEARQLLLELHAEFPNDAQVNYQCAWIHDLLGLELEAIPFYQQALTLFPDSQEFNVFLAMAYYNMNEHDKAMELLLNSLVNTSKDEGILRY